MSVTLLHAAGRIETSFSEHDRAKSDSEAPQGG